MRLNARPDAVVLVTQFYRWIIGCWWQRRNQLSTRFGYGFGSFPRMSVTYFTVSGICGTPRSRSTLPDPALYAESVKLTSPAYLASNCFNSLVPASTFCLGSNGSLTPNCAAVVGMSCIKPCAPLGDTAHGRLADS